MTGADRVPLPALVWVASFLMLWVLIAASSALVVAWSGRGVMWSVQMYPDIFWSAVGANFFVSAVAATAFTIWVVD